MTCKPFRPIKLIWCLFSGIENINLSVSMSSISFSSSLSLDKGSFCYLIRHTSRKTLVWYWSRISGKDDPSSKFLKNCWSLFISYFLLSPYSPHWSHSSFGSCQGQPRQNTSKGWLLEVEGYLFTRSNEA